MNRRNYVLLASLLLAGVTACKEKQAPQPAKVDPRSAAIERAAAAQTSKVAAASTPRLPVDVPNAIAKVPGQVLTVAQAKFSLTGKPFAVDENGTLSQAGKAVGRITADGKLLDAKNRLVAQMDAAGTVTFPDNPELSGKANIGQDGSLTIDGKSFVRLDDQGKMYSRDASTSPLQPEGIVRFEGSDQMRQTYALMVAASVSAKAKAPSTAPVAPQDPQQAEP